MPHYLDQILCKLMSKEAFEGLIRYLNGKTLRAVNRIKITSTRNWYIIMTTDKLTKENLYAFQHQEKHIKRKENDISLD
jgi:hypothetical protein